MSETTYDLNARLVTNSIRLSMGLNKGQIPASCLFGTTMR